MALYVCYTCSRLVCNVVLALTSRMCQLQTLWLSEASGMCAIRLVTLFPAVELLFFL